MYSWLVSRSGRSRIHSIMKTCHKQRDPVGTIINSCSFFFSFWATKNKIWAQKLCSWGLCSRSIHSGGGDGYPLMIIGGVRDAMREPYKEESLLRELSKIEEITRGGALLLPLVRSIASSSTQEIGGDVQWGKPAHKIHYREFHFFLFFSYYFTTAQHIVCFGSVMI